MNPKTKDNLITAAKLVFVMAMILCGNFITG